MSICPICSSRILRHINHHQIYWYCPHCHQTVPNLTQSSVSPKIRDIVAGKSRQSVTVKI